MSEIEWVTIAEAAAILHKKAVTIRNYCNADKFAHTKKNGTWLIGKCCLAPGSMCKDGVVATSGDDTGEAEATAAENKARKLEAEARAVTAEIKIAEANGKLDRPEVLKQREEGLDQRDRELDDREEGLRGAAARYQLITDKEVALQDKKNEATAIMRDARTYAGKLKALLANLHDACRDYVKYSGSGRRLFRHLDMADTAEKAYDELDAFIMASGVVKVIEAEGTEEQGSSEDEQ